MNARLDCHLGFVQTPEIFLFVKYFWSRLLYRVCSVAAAVTQSCAVFLAQNRLLDGFCSVLLYYVMLSLSQLTPYKTCIRDLHRASDVVSTDAKLICFFFFLTSVLNY